MVEKNGLLVLAALFCLLWTGCSETGDEPNLAVSSPIPQSLPVWPDEKPKPIAKASGIDLTIKPEPIVDASATGWMIKPGSTRSPCETIVVNPRGQEFNIGATWYPDILPTSLWLVEVKELDARFLLIHVPPTASGCIDMPVLLIDRNDQISPAGSVGQHFEFHGKPDGAPGYDPIVGWDGWHHLRDLLFRDADGDGIPELIEERYGFEEFTITYHKWTDSKTFVPAWREINSCPGGTNCQLAAVEQLLP